MAENEAPIDIAVNALPNADVVFWITITVIIIIFLGIGFWLWWNTL